MIGLQHSKAILTVVGLFKKLINDYKLTHMYQLNTISHESNYDHLNEFQFAMVNV